ncbi:IS3 family transposase, partial [Kitasatospora aureofaciens]|nr:IS3 family transposase [Kitasatospora aureofaciens]
MFEDARTAALEKLSGVVGRAKACAALGVNRATWYRHHRKSPAPPKPVRESRPHPKALSPEEREKVVAKLNGERFKDTAPAEVYATLLDEGVYL